MCLIIEKEAKLQIAQEDLIVYKEVIRMANACLAIFYNKKYILGELYQTEIEESDPYKWRPYNHEESSAYFGAGYANAVDEFSCKETLDKFNVKSFSEGFHSSEQNNISTSETIVECTIPKGSEYYINKIGLIVSNQIIINKFIS
jgi:hypothetical protein